MSLLGLIAFGILLALVAVVGMRILPSALEYVSIQRTVAKIANSGESNPRDMRNSFDKLAGVEDIVSIKGADLRVERDGSMVLIAFEYEKRVPLYGPVSLLIDFRGKATGFSK